MKFFRFLWGWWGSPGNLAHPGTLLEIACTYRQSTGIAAVYRAALPIGCTYGGAIQIKGVL